MTALVTIAEPALPVVFAAELELASDFAKASKAKSTQAAYSSDFRIFDAWCRERGLTALPAMPATVCAFLAAQAGLGKRASTLQRRLAAIAYNAQDRQHAEPDWRRVHQGHAERNPALHWCGSGSEEGGHERHRSEHGRDCGGRFTAAVA
jgi:hypothetical protein